MHVFQLEKHQQRPLLVPLKEREYEDSTGLQNGDCTGGLIKAAKLDTWFGWMILTFKTAFFMWTTTWKKEERCPKSGSKHTRLRAVHWSTPLHSSLEVRIEHQDTRFSEKEQRAQKEEQGAGQIAQQQEQQAGLCMEWCWELSIERYSTQIKLHCLCILWAWLTYPPPPDSSVIHCKTLGPCNDYFWLYLRDMTFLCPCMSLVSNDTGNEYQDTWNEKVFPSTMVP